MPIVTERIYRNHVIYICPAIMEKDAKGEAEVSIFDPAGKEWFTGEAYGTEAGMFHHAEGVVDAELAPNDEDGANDPDGPWAAAWRSRHGY